MRDQVPAASGGQRLDLYLAGHLGLPRNQIQRWVRAGCVRVNGAAVKPSLPLAGGDWLEWEPLPPADDRVGAEPGELRVLFEDEQVVILDKPAGIAVHPGAGRRSGTLAHFLLHRYPELLGVGGPGRPGIVHRLDKDTTGVLAVARSAAAYQILATAFACRQVRKRYLAVVYGAPRPQEGRIEGAIGRHPRRRQEMTVRGDGRPALTSYRTVAAAAGLALLEIDLATGRTHQIRVHLKSIGHPLVGDPVYGEARWKSLPRPTQARVQDFTRPALHAWRLGFHHPATGNLMNFEAPPPEDLRRLWRDATRSDFPL